MDIPGEEESARTRRKEEAATSRTQQTRKTQEDFFFNMEDSGEQVGRNEHRSPESQTSQVIKILEALKEASHTLHTTKVKSSSSSISSAPINALLELETETAIFSDDPALANLAHHLSHLKSLFNTLHQSKPNSPIRSFFHRRANAHHISRVAGSIETEIQAWIDRETVESLVHSLAADDDDDQKLSLMRALERRAAQGFDRELQDLVLKLKVFAAVESTLCSATASKAVREQAAFVIAALVQFNKNVFVGEVLMGPTVRALVSTATSSAIRVLCSLIRSIKSPLVEDMQSNRELPKIIGFLGCEEVEVRISALDLVLEIGYFGRKEAVEEMIEGGLVKKLIELQRSDGGGSLIEMGGMKGEEEEKGVKTEAAAASKTRNSKEMRFLERHPFASCVARFAIQLEVGEGLRQREKRALKLEVLRRVREASSSDAEAATILAEVLWGASP